MNLTSRVTTALLLILATFTLPCAAQTVSGDTTKGDTAKKVQPDTASRARADSGARPRFDSAATAKPPAPPVDSALARACGQPGGVLVVVFRASATAGERAAAAKAAGAKVAGPAGGDGVYYVQVPGAGVNAAADRLIRMESVRGISAAQCPPQ